MENSKRNIFLNRSDFGAELVALWRVVVAVVLAQIVGGAVSVCVGSFGFWFIDFWYGGAVATVFGYAIGLVWQTKVVRESWGKHRSMLLFMGLASLVLCVAAFVLPLDKAAAATQEEGRMHKDSGQRTSRG